MGILPGAANSQATVLDPSDTVPVGDAVATDYAVCAPPTRWGLQLPLSPRPEIDNRFDEEGGKASPGAHTDSTT